MLLALCDQPFLRSGQICLPGREGGGRNRGQADRVRNVIVMLVDLLCASSVSRKYCFRV